MSCQASSIRRREKGGARRSGILRHREESGDYKNGRSTSEGSWAFCGTSMTSNEALLVSRWRFRIRAIMRFLALSRLPGQFIGGISSSESFSPFANLTWRGCECHASKETARPSYIWSCLPCTIFSLVSLLTYRSAVTTFYSVFYLYFIIYRGFENHSVASRSAVSRENSVLY